MSSSVLAMEHTLSFYENYPDPTGMFFCSLCWEKGCGPIYLCLDCDLGVHAACAATAKQQTHFSHPQHPLHLHHCGDRFRKCGSCGLAIHTWCFRCEICDFNIHSLCVKAPRFIIHHSHPHPLQIFEKAAMSAGSHQCNGCSRPLTDLFYECHSCEYRLHQFCATLSPSIYRHPKHPDHILQLRYEPSNQRSFFTCSECGEQERKWQFHCKICNYDIDAPCATFFHELPHASMSKYVDEMTTTSNGAATSSISSTSALHKMSNISVMPSNRDLDAVERFLHFAREIIHGALPNADEQEEDTCPTCLEGFHSGNPRRTTSCGHHFHVACMLKWMKKSSFCPLCRKDLSVAM